MATTGDSAATKQERVYKELRERILSGTYSPGYRIVFDTLAKEFGVSAVPVREAVRRLEAEGLVVYRANAGAQVAPADPGLYDQELTILGVLEGYATAIAAEVMTEADIAQLTRLTDGMEEAMAELDGLRFGRLNHEFHAVIYRCCPNPRLVEMLNDVARRLDAIRRTVFVQIPYRGRDSVKEHRRLIDLIARRAPAADIEAAARGHKLRTVEAFRSWQRKDGAVPPPAP